MNMYAIRRAATFPALLALAAVSACRSVDYRSQRYDYGTGAVHRYDPQKSLSREEMEARWRQEDNGRVFLFSPYPKYPAPDEEVSLDLAVLKKEAGSEVPVTGAVIAVNAHIASSLEHVNFSQPCAQYEEVSTGHYRVCLAFSAGGDWEVDFKITKGAEVMTVHFPIKVKMHRGEISEAR